MRYPVADCAYAAGIIDGDGTITGSRSQLTVQLCVSQVGPEVPRWLQKKFGGRCYEEQNYRKMFTWRIAQLKAKDFLQAIFPYLILKQRQAAVALEYIDTMPGSGRGRGKSDELVQKQFLLIDMIQKLNKGEIPCAIL